MSAPDYDVIVIGGGPGGYVAAIRAAQLGMRTAVVEQAHLGGICLNWGCIPTKALLRSAEIFHEVGEAASFGVVVPGAPTLDLKVMLERSRDVARELNTGVGFLLKKNGVDVIWGTATLRGGGGDRRRCSRIERTQQSRAAEGRQGHRPLHRRAYHHRHRRAAARPPGHRAGRPKHLDVFRGHAAAGAAALAADRRVRRHRHRVRLVLSHARRRGDGGRAAAGNPARRGRGDRGAGAQGVREAGHSNSHRRQGRRGETRQGRHHRKHRAGGRQKGEHRCRAHDLRRRCRRQCRRARARGAGRQAGERV